MKVSILATCRKPELIRATTLVFDTIRTGFPTAKIEVCWNGLASSREVEIARDAVTKAGASFVTIAHTTHHEWLCSILKYEDEATWICDTDVVFWDSMEQFDFNGVPLAGRFIPQFFCNFANAITKERLHTSLLRIDPVKVRELSLKFGKRFPDVYCTPRPTLEDLVFPRYVPRRNEQPLFYDTMSVMWHAIGGHSFSSEHQNCYDHLNSATLSDLVGPCYPHYRMRETHFAIFENPQLAKGSWKLQDEFYAKHEC